MSSSADPEIATRGAANGPRLVAFTSDQSHYSYLKSARLTGLGSDNLIEIPSDERGRMCPERLEEAVIEAKESDCVPFFCGSTAGTTVLGAYDPFDRPCEEFARDTECGITSMLVGVEVLCFSLTILS